MNETTGAELEAMSAAKAALGETGVVSRDFRIAANAQLETVTTILSILGYEINNQFDASIIKGS